MAHSLGTIREFTTEHFHVIIDAIEETSPDLSWDEDGDTAERIDNGLLILFCARARVITHAGIELAADYLGNCVYESLDAFEDHRLAARYTRELAAKGERGVCGSYFADMISNVCREARIEYARLAESFQTIKLRSVN